MPSIFLSAFFLRSPVSLASKSPIIATTGASVDTVDAHAKRLAGVRVEPALGDGKGFIRFDPAGSCCSVPLVGEDGSACRAPSSPKRPPLPARRITLTETRRHPRLRVQKAYLECHHRRLFLHRRRHFRVILRGEGGPHAGSLGGAAARGLLRERDDRVRGVGESLSQR